MTFVSFIRYFSAEDRLELLSEVFSFQHKDIARWRRAGFEQPGYLSRFFSCSGSGRSCRPTSRRCRKCPACFVPFSWKFWTSWRRSRKPSDSPASGTESLPRACPWWTSAPASRSTRLEAQWAWPQPWHLGRPWVTWKQCQRTWREGWMGRRGPRGCGAHLTSGTKGQAAVSLKSDGTGWGSAALVRHQ